MMSEEEIYLDQLNAAELEKNSADDAPEQKQQESESVYKVDASTDKKTRTPRRVLHFSDGTLEEYSTDEEEDQTDLSTQQLIVDTSTMSWGGWLGHHAYTKGNTALAACDYVGENIAYFLGITSPKYHYELEEHKRTLEEEERERLEVADQMVGWSSDGVADPLQQPTSLPQTYLLGTEPVACVGGPVISDSGGGSPNSPPTDEGRY